uniref:Uncharacterized protein n=1 Tax=Setaria digitata TaxID=48799 RepID=A0A915PQR2_9BILA
MELRGVQKLQILELMTNCYVGPVKDKETNETQNAKKARKSKRQVSKDYLRFSDELQKHTSIELLSVRRSDRVTSRDGDYSATPMVGCVLFGAFGEERSVAETEVYYLTGTLCRRLSPYDMLINGSTLEGNTEFNY